MNHLIKRSPFGGWLGAATGGLWLVVSFAVAVTALGYATAWAVAGIDDAVVSVAHLFGGN